MNDTSLNHDFPEWRELLTLGSLLLQQPTLDAQQLIISEICERLLDCKCKIWLLESVFSTPLGLLPEFKYFTETGYTSLIARAIRTKQTVVNHRTKPLGRMIAIPLQTHGMIMGGMQFFRSKGSFKDDEIGLIQGISSQFSIAIDNYKQRAMDHWQVELLSLVHKVSAQIATLIDLDELAIHVSDLILKTFQYYYVAIFTLEPVEGLLRFRASAGPITQNKAYGKAYDHDPPEKTSTGEYIPILNVLLGEGIIGYVAKSGEEILANDVSKDLHYRYFDVLPETRSEVALPLRAGENILGVLDVQSDLLNAFNDIDLLVLRTLAGHIATALENARLYFDIQKRANYLSSIAEVSNAITSILDLDVLLNNIVTLIHSRFDYPFVCVYTVQQNSNQIIYRAGCGDDDIVPEEGHISYNIEEESCPVAWVAHRGKTFVAQDLSKYAQNFRVRKKGIDPSSEISVPLLFGDQILGVLDIYSDRVNAFGSDEIFLFEALADNIAVALRNANLYHSERWRRQVAESMREIAGLLSADVELGQVLDRILTKLDTILPCDAAAIWLLATTESATGVGQFISPLHLAAVHSKSGSIELQGTQTENLQEIFQSYSLVAENSPWITQALESHYPIIREPETLYEPLGAILDFPSDYSAIAAPLRIGEQAIGLLVLSHHDPGRYGSESQAMTATFASYAAVAIENTRLYEAAHDQAWISTVILQVTEATQSLTSLNELLDTVVHIIPQLVGVKACALLYWDKVIEALLPAASYGFNPVVKIEFEKMCVFENDIPAFEEVRRTRAPVVLNRESLSSIGGSNYQISLDLGVNSLVLFPMISQIELQGFILVELDSEMAENDDPDVWDQKFSIIQGIAHQTAIATENIRLLEAQKEDAYISVALLQVAQAVVNQNDLNDVLSAIVRITPILIGVKRCIIYIWDPVKAVYYQSQSYGISRGEQSSMLSTYSQMDFPMLEAIHQQNQLVYREITEPFGEFYLWTTLPLNEFGFSHLIASEIDINVHLEHNFDFLKSKKRLMLGFPLSARGNFLGVMLVEEESTPKGVPSYHIREKRLEIITGITQQAALAIQNDLFQHEVLEHERLERELQLAREIQKTFMPDELPHLTGWELDIRWTPARQVGGDFYDVFELPGNKLGVLIADVADKGMPAALFMTLTRTLIRAVVKDVISPAVVLTRVNNLLVPDSNKGMFVTIFYAVISLDSNLITYANAGHNPPLLLRARTMQLEELSRCGMALGVFDGIEMVEREVYIEPGDSLVLYTDGVTEAFSPDDELYSIGRLKEAIMADNIQSAHTLVESILNSVNNFINGTPPSDDLTLVVLHRTAENNGVK